ncbi:hypothetical protein [Cytobacillus firmus]|uniref:hypothetical protein n=1 Tax=Cytobacillus firmus TaxID=1399 RepID=UPI00136349A0|nr:hypothetical protein [Cytobacillus firmus]
MRKDTKIARRKKRLKALAKMKWYRNWNYREFYKAKKMYESTLKNRYPYTKSNF